MPSERNEPLTEAGVAGGQRPQDSWRTRRKRAENRAAKVRRRAWAIHHANGHPKGYSGPCWGPLPAEVEQAKREFRDA